MGRDYAFCDCKDNKEKEGKEGKETNLGIIYDINNFIYPKKKYQQKKILAFFLKINHYQLRIIKKLCCQ